MKRDFSFPSADGVTKIWATEWIPEGEIRAVLQISHGMVEYIGRYAHFAEYLNEHGIYVVGNDHLGHGRSVTGEEKLGYFKHPDGLECVIADLHTLRCRTAEQYPDVPYYFLGHSMGSFLLRQYLMLHGEGLAGAIVMGTGSQPKPIPGFGMLVCRLIAAFKGWEHRSAFVYAMAFSSNNKSFEPARTSYDWLTKDEKIVDAYRVDPWCTYWFTLDGFYQLFRTIRYIQQAGHIARIPADCPILMVSGADDPVGAAGAGVRKAYRALRDAGKNVSMKLYAGDRHEILNETDRQTVYDDLLSWMTEGTIPEVQI